MLCCLTLFCLCVCGLVCVWVCHLYNGESFHLINLVSPPSVSPRFLVSVFSLGCVVLNGLLMMLFWVQPPLSTTTTTFPLAGSSFHFSLSPKDLFRGEGYTIRTLHTLTLFALFFCFYGTNLSLRVMFHYMHNYSTQMRRNAVCTIGWVLAFFFSFVGDDGRKETVFFG